MENHKHILITFDGLSGSGKTRLAKAVADTIGAYYISTPTNPLKDIRSEITSIQSQESRFLYYLANIAQISSELPDMLQHKSVVIDKYVYTTLAYAYSRNNSISLPEFLTVKRPDLGFLVTCDEKTRINRILSREGSLDFRSPEMTQREKVILEKLQTFGLIEIDNSDNPNSALETISELINKTSR